MDRNAPMARPAPADALARVADFDTRGAVDIEHEARERLGSAAADNAQFFASLLAGLAKGRWADNLASQRTLVKYGAQYFYLLGESARALPALQAVATTARRMDDVDSVVNALASLGLLYADAGMTTDAFETFTDGLELLPQVADRAIECRFLINLGHLMTLLAHYREAVALLERAVLRSQGCEEARMSRATALTNLAFIQMHVGNCVAASEYADAALAANHTPATGHARLIFVLAEVVNASAALLSGDAERAETHCEKSEAMALACNMQRADTATRVMRGLICVYRGEHESGLEMIRASVEAARRFPARMRYLLRSLSWAYERVGQPDEALRCLRELNDYTQSLEQENLREHLEHRIQQVLMLPLPGDHIRLPMLQREAELRIQAAEKRELEMRLELLERLAVTAELRDDATGEHSYRVGRLAALLARECGCDDETQAQIEVAARLHDIGKIGIPDAILLKPGRLSDHETDVMRRHAVIGAELLAKSRMPHLRMAEEIARGHHEWWNGTGYPHRTSGVAIPFVARVVALADVFDALTHVRPYKPAWSVGRSLETIVSLKALQFDPELTESFLALIARLTREHGARWDEFLSESARQSPFLLARRRMLRTLTLSHQAAELTGTPHERA